VQFPSRAEAEVCPGWILVKPQIIFDGIFHVKFEINNPRVLIFPKYMLPVNRQQFCGIILSIIALIQLTDHTDRSSRLTINVCYNIEMGPIIEVVRRHIMVMKIVDKG